MICGALAGMAQTLHSSYFLENMPYRHQLNPAFMSPSGYVGFPVLGNFNIMLNSNVGFGTFLYPRGNELATFLHSSVGTKEFLGKLNTNNSIEAAFDVALISFGFNAWGGSNTFSISAKGYSATNVPYDLLAFLKQGQENNPNQIYSIKNLREQISAYGEIALGHARPINDRLNVGAKVKILLGLGYADMNIDRMDIRMSQDRWMITNRGYFNTSKGLRFNYTENNEIDFDNEPFDEYKIGLDGAGFGLDLGATYRLLDNLTLSASLLDIGFISWSNATEMNATPEPFVFDGFQHIGAEDKDNGDNAFDDEKDRLEDDLKALYKFRKKGEGSQTKSLRTTMNIAAEYGLLNNKISFGLLSSTRFGAPSVWTEVMASANFRPSKWFHAAVNGSLSNKGHSFGVLLNLCPKGFNFFIGSDYIVTKYAPSRYYFIPINQAKFNVNFGINFTFGHKYRD
jgi:hypothetical protein